MPESLLDEMIGRYGALPKDKQEQLARDALAATDGLSWIPNPGPQTQAYYCKADVLLYGGQGGGGKSSLLNGLAATRHRRSLIMRRQYTNLTALIDEALEINGGRKGYNGAIPPSIRNNDRFIEFGACAHLGDEQSWQGQPHDLIGFDEAAQFLESQIRFLMGWNRPGTGVPVDQRCRVVLASNPPVTAEGQWMVEMFAAWLDPNHPNPAAHGELRWYVTDEAGKDREVDGPEQIVTGRIKEDGNPEVLTPLSRTFIPASLSDNPFLRDTGYDAQLDALPEPLRSAVRDGNFMAARQDDMRQLIPSAWVHAAQQRFTERPPYDVPMCAMGVDIAQGGPDETVLAIRYDGWYAPLIAVPGKDTPDGPSAAALVIKHRRDDCDIIIDMGGGYGGSCLDHLKGNDIEHLYAYKGAEGSTRRTSDRKLTFFNRRSEAWWRFREALDPSQRHGSPISLPADSKLVADLTSPTFDIGMRGIQVETKEKLVKRLGRSPDRGDAVVMAWHRGARAQTHARTWNSEEQGMGKRRPQVRLGHERKRR